MVRIELKQARGFSSLHCSKNQLISELRCFMLWFFVQHWMFSSIFVTEGEALETAFLLSRLQFARRPFECTTPNWTTVLCVRSALCLGYRWCYLQWTVGPRWNLEQLRKKTESKGEEEVYIPQIHFVECPWQQCMSLCASLWINWGIWVCMAQEHTRSRSQCWKSLSPL